MPERVVVADFNEDGIPDIAGASFGITAADYNSDGILDLACGIGYAYVQLGIGIRGRAMGSFGPLLSYAGGVGDSIAVLLGGGSGGAGDGSFGAAMRYRAASSPRRIAKGDFNSDGIVDLVVVGCCSPDSTWFSILIGQGAGGVGNGTFSAGSTYRSYQVSANEIAVADLNQDAIQDLIVTNNYGAWLFCGRGSNGIGDGSFDAPVQSSLSCCGGFVVADFDSDGYPDVAMSAWNLQVSRNLGSHAINSATLSPPVYYPLPAGWNGSGRGSAAGDFNQDGIIDLALTGYYGSNESGFGVGKIAIFLGAGSGGRGSGAFAGGVGYEDIYGNGQGCAAADLDGDGIGDLLSTGGSAVLIRGRCPSRAAAAPMLVSVRDVPNDQGGHVSVRWAHSPLDVSSVRLITGYTVWRRLAPSTALASALPVEPSPQRALVAGWGVLRVRQDGGASTYWEPLTTLPAHFLEGYGYTAATTQDSIKRSNPYTAFFVSALTEDPFLFFESSVDSGYSVDNLAPDIPRGVAGRLLEPGILRLHWHPNVEADLHHYAIYRSSDPTFVRDDANRIGVTADTSFVDTGFGTSTFYRITAVDVHGNESPNPPIVTGSDLTSPRTRLYSIFEPSGGGPIEIRYGIGPRRASAHLAVFDVAGRLVRSIGSWTREPGQYLQTWDRRDATGKAVTRGVYLVRLQAGAVTVSRKTVLVRG